MRPPRQGFSANDLSRGEFELRLVRHPNFTAIDRFVELAQHGQFPGSILERLGIVIFPFEAVVSGFFGRDQRARQPILDRAAAADFDTEGDGQVNRHAADARGIAKQRIKRLEVVAERLTRFLEPGEDAGVSLIKHPGRRSDLQPRYNLVDELAFAVRRQRRNDFFVIEQSSRDECVLAPLDVRPERGEEGSRPGSRIRALGIGATLARLPQ
jgi:hypothetical protein